MKICNYVLLAATMSTAGCAVNPQTGTPEIAPAVKSQFNDTFNSDDPCSNNDRNIGVLTGAVAGGLIGYLSHGAKGAVIGAVAGAGGGLLLGHLMDARRCSLYKIAQANRLHLASAPITPGKLGLQGKNENSAIGLDVQLQNKSDEFEVGSSKLTPAARAYLAQIAQLYAPQALGAGLSASTSPQERQQAMQHSVLIVGHTDGQDAAAGADLARLSQERAKAVADVFAQSGVPASNIYYQGAGDALPLTSNATQEGRAANDRVQIVDVPTQGDLELYLQRRGANPANFDNAVTGSDHATENAGADAPASREGTRSPVADADADAIDTPAIQAQASPHARMGEQASDAARTSVVQRPTHVAAATSQRGVAALAPAQTARNDHAQRGVDTGEYDFGGGPIHPPGEPINLGAAVDHSMFNLITPAHADTPVVVGSCMSDHPHTTTPVRNLQTAQELPPRDFVRGFYGTVWATNANGNLVAITGAAIPLDAGAPIPRPTVLIYRNYRGNTHQAPSFKGQPNVNVYRGTQKTVYRVFIDGPARCLDLVVAAAQFKGLGNLYYYDNGNAFLATPEFAMQR